MSTYRFSWLRPGGWTRLGLAGAVAIMFVTPMLWALGVFGAAEDTLKRALIFLFAGMWFCVGVGYMVGWAIRGFVVKVKEAEEDEEGAPARRPAPPHAPTGSAHRPAH